MREQDASDASKTTFGRIASLRSIALRISIPGLAIAFVALALYGAHLHYLDDGTLFSLWLTAFALVVFGIAVRHSGYVSQGSIALGASAVVFIIGLLLALPPGARVERGPDFSSMSAMDAKIDRFIRTQQVSPSVLATASFNGFDAGSEVLDCDNESVRRGLNSIVEGLKQARKIGVKPILVLVGMTDRMPLGKALRQRYESSAGLASARANAVEACVNALRRDVFPAGESLGTVRLTTGPNYTPEFSAPPPVEVARMAQDRQVNALLFGVPSATAVSAGQPGIKPDAGIERPPMGHRDPKMSQWQGLLVAGGVTGLTFLALVIFLWCRNQASSDAPPNVEVQTKSADVADAISHVRELHEMFAELRTKNFNFFIVIVAAAIAGAAGITEKTNLTLQFVSSLAAAGSCIVFFGIEKRTVEMLADARLELERLEELIGVYLSRRDRWVGGTRPRRLTHTRLYEAAFIIVYLGALVSIFVHRPW